MIKADYQIGGYWGDSINWCDPTEFDRLSLDTDTMRVYGFKKDKPVVGSTITGEFAKSFIKFEFVEVTTPGDPPDQFFGKVKAIEQVMK